MDVMAATEILARSSTLTNVGWIGYIIIGALAGWIAGKIVKGGSGAWGPVPMPAQPQVNAQEASSLAAWILEQR